MAFFWLNSKKVLGARVRQTEGAAGQHPGAAGRADLRVEPPGDMGQGQEERNLLPGVGHGEFYPPCYMSRLQFL